ncbi:MAG: hypothetical protein GKR88_02110 [Flavobacteriaceae bacterium]|nr:MAG: hypothetical protein GKR88_02110 [Flavobacteriaceae bacterium]
MNKTIYKAWIDCRVSSSGQGQGDSLEIQERKAKQFLFDTFGITADQIKVFREKYSGRKSTRPTFDAILEFSKLHQSTLQYGCFTNIDRFTRAGGAFYSYAKEELKSLGIQLVDVEGIIQPERNMLKGSGGKFGDDFQYDWSTYSPSQENEIQRAERSLSEVRQILQRFVEKQIEYVQQGFQNRSAPYGFENTKFFNPNTGKKRTILKILLNEAQYIRLMYQLASQVHQGIITTRTACDKLNAQGYRSRIRQVWNTDRSRIIGTSGQKPITPKQFWNYVRRPIYAGFVCEKWTHYHLVPSQSPKLIDIELWNAANQDRYTIVKDNNNSTGWKLFDKRSHQKRTYRTNNPDFPYKGLIRCSHCNKPLKAGASTGRSGKRFPLYFCNRGHKQISVNPNQLQQILMNLFTTIDFDPAAIKVFLKSAKLHLFHKINTTEQLQQEQNSQREQLRQKAEAILKKLEYLTHPDLILKCQQDYETIQDQITLLKSSTRKKAYSKAEIDQKITDIEKTIEHLDDTLINPHQMELLSAFWRCAFTEIPTLEELENRTPKMSPIVRTKGNSEVQKEEWWNTEDSSRTLLDEIVRWGEILKGIFDTSTTYHLMGTLHHNYGNCCQKEQPKYPIKTLQSVKHSFSRFFETEE